MDKNFFRRTRLLIFPRFQLQLIAINLFVLLLSAAVIWFQMSSSFTELKSSANLAGPEGDLYRNLLDYHSKQLIFSLASALLAAISVSVFVTLILSHRFSGPMIRLKNYFLNLSQNPQSEAELSFRKNDFLHEIPPLVNSALEGIRKNRK